MEEPKLLTAFLPSEQDILTADVLQLGAELWLVSSWLESPDGKFRTPERAIRLRGQPYQWTPGLAADLVLNNPIPRAVLDGKATQAEGIQYEVVEGPSDRFPVLPIRRAQ